MSTRIAFLGLGAMGRIMARHLIDAGHRVTVWNRSPGPASALVEAGAQAALTPAAAARGADVVVSMLADDEAARTVWLDPERGVLAGLSADAIAVAAGTLSPACVASLAAAVGRTGASFVEAPVAGSTPQATAGALRSLVGGEASVVERVRPVLACWSGAVVHAGPVGAGSVLKLMVNGLFTVQVAAMAELVSLARARGHDPSALLSRLSDTPVCSPAAAMVGRRMLQADHPSQFPVRLVEKDLRYVVSAAGGADAAPVAEAARGAFAALATQGLADANLTVLGWERLRSVDAPA